MEEGSRLRGPRCGVDNCPSTRYHIGPDGFKYCQRNHQVDNVPISQQEDYFGPSSKASRAQALEPKGKQSKELQGPQAVEHLLLCYQLLLWKQCHWLINTRDFTQELEEVVRNRVWRSFLQVLASEGVLRDASQANEQFLSTQSSHAEDTEQQPFSTRKPNQLPRLEDGLAMLYLSCNILRIPIMVEDARRWAFADGFPYVRAEAAIPEQLMTKLPMSYRRTFQSRTGPPDLGRLHKTTMQLAVFLQHPRVEVPMPRLNMELLLLRVVRLVGLPLDCYQGVQRLGLIVECDFNFPNRGQKSLYLTDHPEIQLISLVIITAKLFYPFDAVDRKPQSRSEPSALAVDWKEWSGVFKNNVVPEAASKDDEDWLYKVTEDDVMKMRNEQLDDYLDWFERTWIKSSTTETARPVRQDAIGVETSGSQASRWSRGQEGGEKRVKNRIQSVQASLVSREPGVGRDKPGDKFTQYRTESDLPGVARPFFERAATLVGLPVGLLVPAVYRMEVNIQAWERGERKKRKSAEFV